jgi:hypothetical protein
VGFPVVGFTLGTHKQSGEHISAALPMRIREQCLPVSDFAEVFPLVVSQRDVSEVCTGKDGKQWSAD